MVEELQEYFDVFTNEFTNESSKSMRGKLLHEFENRISSTISPPIYQSLKKLLADEYLAADDDLNCALHLSESVSAQLRILAVYRTEQIKISGDNLYNIKKYIKPVQDITSKAPKSNTDSIVDNLFNHSRGNISRMLKKCDITEDLPFYKQYLRFSSLNNVENFQKICNELPKEWTIVQLTASYNPKENLISQSGFKKDINSLYLSVFKNYYTDKFNHGPITIRIPANIPDEGLKPVFEELYDVLQENYSAINHAQYISNRKLVNQYWAKRENVDLRMVGVLNTMDQEWLGGWCSLLTGNLVDSTIRDVIVKLIDHSLEDWGFIKLTTKQKILLYNLIECSTDLSETQIKTCICRILTEQGIIADTRRAMKNVACKANKCKDFTYFPSELCWQCLAECYEAVHHFTLVDSINALIEITTSVKEHPELTGLRKAKRHPVILIVDEILDSFPWECLSVLRSHPVSRMENIHFIYYLYKIHEQNIVNGYYQLKIDTGRYIINPEKNLDRMQNRMSSFVQYWCGKWRGHVGEKVSSEEFVEYLTNSDMFLYCGHGDGLDLVSGANIEARSCGRGVVALSGCGSLRLTSPPGPLLPSSSHHHLHINGCPLVIGMLWEVTDLEVDKVMSTLISLYMPSDAPLPWPTVGKSEWSEGKLDTSVPQEKPFTQEHDVLRALCRSRRASKYIMISTSLISRGLPVMVIQ